MPWWYPGTLLDQVDVAIWCRYVPPLCSRYHYCTTSFIHQSLNSGFTHVQILLAACWRFAMVSISDNRPLWKQSKKSFVGQPWHNSSYSSSTSLYLHALFFSFSAHNLNLLCIFYLDERAIKYLIVFINYQSRSHLFKTIR